MTRMWNGGVNAMPVVLLLAALSVAAPAAGQDGTEPRVWTTISVQSPMGADSAWRLASESFVRTRDGAGTLDFLGERVMLTVDLTRQSGAGIGYAYGAAFPDAGSLREHRLVEQYTWSAGVKRRVSLRSRLEERFVTGNDALLLRVRQQVRVTWPLAAKGRLRGVASEELFVHTNSTALASRGFDSNRIFVGIGRTLTPRSAAEIGYMNVYWRGKSSRNWRSHVISATLVASL